MKVILGDNMVCGDDSMVQYGGSKIQSLHVSTLSCFMSEYLHFISLSDKIKSAINHVQRCQTVTNMTLSLS